MRNFLIWIDFQTWEMGRVTIYNVIFLRKIKTKSFPPPLRSILKGWLFIVIINFEIF
jgi:hypothetical protein